MTSFLQSALAVHDVESDLHFVEIEYTKYDASKREYLTFKDYLQTKPAGDWTRVESRRRDVRYDRFLRAMVAPTLEVKRRSCELVLDALLDFPMDAATIIRVALCAKILEPSFKLTAKPSSRWQIQIARNVVHALSDLIDECVDENKLDRMLSVLQLIETEL